MTLLGEIVNVIDLKREVDNGYVRVATHPDYPVLMIANYTEKAQFEKHWNQVTLNCRGLIWDSETWEVLARPFPKFFNDGEGWEPDTPPPVYSDDEAVQTYDKVDGSLGILYFYDGKPWIATRGSFASEQARHATEVFRERYSDFVPGEGYTALFEIVYPENRIVLDYKGMDDLVLLGSVHMDSGTPFGTQYIATRGWTGPKVKRFSKLRTLGEVRRAARRPNAEGYVVNLPHQQVMLKIKQPDYVALHKTIFGLNERAVWEALGAGKTVEEICEALPDEFHVWVKQVAADLVFARDAVVARAHLEYGEVLRTIGFQHFHRKDFAVEAMKKSDPSLLFMLLDGKDITFTVWKGLRPSADSKPTREVD